MTVRDELAGRSIGEFVLRERIGEGGFGAVYRCEQPLLGREAVIKVLHQRLRANEVMIQRFLREARLASRLDHPYAAHVYAFGVEQDGLLWIAMEMVHGTTLDCWLRERGPLPLPELVPFFERIAEVVQTAHERGIVHRDLKPSNVMVIERAGRLLPKLLDLGIAKLVANELPPDQAPRRRAPRATERERSGQLSSEVGTLTGIHHDVHDVPLAGELTASGAMMGSPPYMAPEQWSDGPVGPASDFYALGVLAYEALAGRRPFVATTMAEYAELHMNAPVPLVEGGLPPALDRWFERALAKSPGDRPSTALELAAALRVASGLAEAPVELPKLDPGIHDAWLADAPKPLAEAVAALVGARNAHQARGEAREVVRGLVRYLVVLALAARSQVRDDHDDPVVVELLRELRRRDLDLSERVGLLRRLVQPFTMRPGTHPIPALVALVTPRDDDHDALDAMLQLEPASDGGGVAEDLLRAQLASLLAALGRLLRAASFVLDYPLVVVRGGAAQQWTGLLRLPRRPVVGVQEASLADGQPAVVDRDGKVAVLLWPLVQVLAPLPGADPELFMFDGHGRHGARLVAAPSGFKHHDAAIWDWLGEHVLGAADRDTAAQVDERPPYLGLATFTAGDAERFVGRERETDAFVNRLCIGAWQVVVGASGAGKSSFVHAGVVPALPPGWRAITMRPGASPIAALAGKLQAANVSTTDLRLLLETSPAAVASLLANVAGEGVIVIVVDQLEELFTLCLDDTERVRFAAVLAELSAADLPLRVICTVRDDFLMRVEALPALGRRLSSAVFLLGNPSHDDLVRTIVEPARRAGYELSDPELARDMAAAVQGRPGALALLSFTASRLWELRDRRFRQLTRAAYDGMGGVGGALGQHAEDTLARFHTGDQRLVREAFRRLVTAEGTRAQLSIAELGQVLASERAGAVVDKLISARLLVTADGEDGSRVELAHESLLAAWPRAMKWIEEDADSARVRDQLGAAARQWQTSGHQRGLLWRDDALAELVRWRRAEARSLTTLESTFADASAADAARGRRLRRGAVLVAFAILAVGVVVLLSLRQRADDARQIAERERQRARTQLAESYEEQGRRALLDGDSGDALAYFDEAFRMGADSPALRYMIARALEPFEADVTTLRGHTAPVMVSKFSPDGTRILTAAEDGTARIWDATRGTELARLEHPATSIDAAWSPDGRQVATIDATGQVRIWSPATGERRVIRYATSPLRGPQVRFTPDGRYLAVSDPTQMPAVLDLARGEWTARLEASEIGYIEVSPRSDRIVGVGSNGDCVLWRITGEQIAVLRGHTAPVWVADFNRDGSLIATVSMDATARVWDAETGAPKLVLKGHEQRVTYLAFSPSGDQLATASLDLTVKLWDLRTGEVRHTLRGHTKQINRLVFTPDGGQLISVAGDGTARVWDTRAGLETAAFAHAGFVYQADVSPDGSRVVTASWDSTARVFSLSRQRRLSTFSAASAADDPPPLVQVGASLLRLSGGSWIVVDLATGARRSLASVIPELDNVARQQIEQCGGDLSGDGMLAAVAIGDRFVRVRRVSDGRATRDDESHRGPLRCVAFAPAGTRLASLDATRELAIWDAVTGATIRRRVLDIDADVVRFSPDGRILLVYQKANTAAPLLLAADTLETISRLGIPPVEIIDAVFAPDSRHLAIAAGDATVWTARGELVEKSAGAAIPTALAWSPDSTYLLVGRADGWILSWGLASSMQQRFQAHDNYVASIGFSSDGALAVVAGGEGKVAVWDVRTSRQLFASMQEVVRVRFDSTGDAVISAGQQRVDIWRADRMMRSRDELAEVVRCRVGLRVDDGRLVPGSVSERCRR